ncbi:alcohol dehydrogenase catalytic domain-containing protein [Candidatus Sumerlaeota bacterium]|nr:alcohol dehydrogenase catalytic domain-containing protein [Candidatus Sumerlaeota bacterium]
MFATQLNKIGSIVFIETERPSLSEGEALIRPRRCGICGSDVHAFEGKHPLMHPPLTLGHEFSGDLEEIKDSSSGIQPGERVTAVPLLYCGQCYNCRQGIYNRCQNLRVIGCQAPGAMAEFVKVPAEMLVKIPAEMPYEIGALIEPFAVGIHAVARSRVNPDSRVLVIGSGTIGLCVLSALKASGVKNVIISDVVDFRLDIAAKLGAKRIVNVSKDDLINALNQEYGDAGTDVIFECVGIEETVTQAINLAQRGGQIIQVGVLPGAVPTPIDILQDHELELIGTLCYLKPDFEKAVELLSSGVVDLSPLITSHFTLKDVQQAFEFILANRAQSLKVMLEISSPV